MNANGSGARITWLGQGGYAIVAPDGTRCLVDPYLSDYLRDELGQPRAAAIVLDPAETQAAVVVSSHWHPDHLDPLTVKPLAARNPEIRFVGPSANTSRLRGWSIGTDRILSLDRGGDATVGGFSFAAYYARHDVPGWLAEDAISLVISVGGLTIYYSGDTEYDSRCLAAKAAGPFDIGFFVTNGSGGNMNAHEAALLAWQLAPQVAVPMHYGMWPPEGYGPGATLDPQLFVDTYRKLGGGGVAVLELGETIEIGRPGA